MNVDHIDFYIPLELQGKRTFLRIQMDGNAYACTGEGFIDPMQSDMGFGETIEGAIIDFLRHYQDYNHQGKFERLIGRKTAIFHL